MSEPQLSRTEANLPRLVIAGLSGDSGKTLISLGILLAAQNQGISVRAFKKGPDYIDAAWLTWASGEPARNLDTFLMGFQTPVTSFARHAIADGLNVVEGNRGLYDGADPRGTHSTAELAKTLHAPVVLVLNATKLTRTAAALVLGCQKLDPGVHIAGVVLNQVATARQEKVIREAIESACSIPVLGALPRVKDSILLPGRHLGLVTPAEHSGIAEVRQNLLGLVQDRLDLERLFTIARQTRSMPLTPRDQPCTTSGQGLKIGYISDSAFTFYYPENLEALEAAGASLVPVSALAASGLPADLNALYIGGGFPETHGASLAANTGLLNAIRDNASKGLPIYAECGGLMLLSNAVIWKGQSYPMAGVLPFKVKVHDKPQGHGYSELVVDRANAYFPKGQILKGHEFHYSGIIQEGNFPSTACAVRRGTGCHERRDGIIAGNVWASYTHLHALATPAWAEGILQAARDFDPQSIA